MARNASSVVVSDQNEFELALSPLSYYGIDEKNIQKNYYKICANCNKIEQKRRTFKICLKCKQLGVEKWEPLYHHYCSKECQKEHWKLHRLEHIRYEKAKIRQFNIGGSRDQESDEKKAEREDTLPNDPLPKNQESENEDEPCLEIAKFAKTPSGAGVLVHDRGTSPVGDKPGIPDKVQFNISAGTSSAKFCLGKKVTKSEGGVETSTVALIKQETTPDGTINATTTPVYEELVIYSKSTWKTQVAHGNHPSKNLESFGKKRDVATSPLQKGDLMGVTKSGKKGTNQLRSSRKSGRGSGKTTRGPKGNEEIVADVSDVPPSSSSSEPFWNSKTGEAVQKSLPPCTSSDPNTAVAKLGPALLKPARAELKVGSATVAEFKVGPAAGTGVKAELKAIPPPIQAELKAIPPKQAELKAIPPKQAELKAIPPKQAEVKAIPPKQAELNATPPKPDSEETKTVVKRKKKKEHEVKDVATLSNKYVTVVDVNQCPPLEEKHYYTDDSSSGSDAGGYMMYILTDEVDGTRSAVVQKRKKKEKKTFNARILFKKDHMRKQRRQIAAKDGKPRQEVIMTFRHPSDDEDEEEEEVPKVRHVSRAEREILSTSISVLSAEAESEAQSESSAKSDPVLEQKRDQNTASITAAAESRSEDSTSSQGALNFSNSGTNAIPRAVVTPEGQAVYNAIMADELKALNSQKSAPKSTSQSGTTKNSPEKSRSGTPVDRKVVGSSSKTTVVPKFDPLSSFNAVCRKINEAFREEMPQPSRIVEVTELDDEIEKTMLAKSSEYTNQVTSAESEKRSKKKKSTSPTETTTSKNSTAVPTKQTVGTAAESKSSMLAKKTSQEASSKSVGKNNKETSIVPSKSAATLRSKQDSKKVPTPIVPIPLMDSNTNPWPMETGVAGPSKSLEKATDNEAALRALMDQSSPSVTVTAVCVQSTSIDRKEGPNIIYHQMNSEDAIKLVEKFQGKVPIVGLIDDVGEERHLDPSSAKLLQKLNALKAQSSATLPSEPHVDPSVQSSVAQSSQKLTGTEPPKGEPHVTPPSEPHGDPSVQSSVVQSSQKLTGTEPPKEGPSVAPPSERHGDPSAQSSTVQSSQKSSGTEPPKGEPHVTPPSEPHVNPSVQSSSTESSQKLTGNGPPKEEPCVTPPRSDETTRNSNTSSNNSSNKATTSEQASTENENNKTEAPKNETGTTPSSQDPVTVSHRDLMSNDDTQKQQVEKNQEVKGQDMGHSSVDPTSEKGEGVKGQDIEHSSVDLQSQESQEVKGQDKDDEFADFVHLKHPTTDHPSELSDRRHFVLKKAGYADQDIEISIIRARNHSIHKEFDALADICALKYYVSRRIKIIPRSELNKSKSANDAMFFRGKGGIILNSNKVTQKPSEWKPVGTMPWKDPREDPKWEDEWTPKPLVTTPATVVFAPETSAPTTENTSASKVPIVEYDMSSKTRPIDDFTSTGKFKVLNSDKEFGDIYSDESIAQLSNPSVDVTHILNPQDDKSETEVPPLNFDKKKKPEQTLKSACNTTFEKDVTKQTLDANATSEKSDIPRENLNEKGTTEQKTTSNDDLEPASGGETTVGDAGPKNLDKKECSKENTSSENQIESAPQRKTMIILKRGQLGFKVDTDGEYRIFTHLYAKRRWTTDEVEGVL